MLSDAGFIPKVNYCPNCGKSFKDSKGLVIEYWHSEDDINFCWCGKCSWRGEIKDVIQIRMMEPEES